MSRGRALPIALVPASSRTNVVSSESCPVASGHATALPRASAWLHLPTLASAHQSYVSLVTYLFNGWSKCAFQFPLKGSTAPPTI